MTFDADHIRLLKDVEMGLDAKHWLHQTALGQQVQSMALQDEHEALLALAAVDPLDTKAVIAAQTRVKVPAMALQWLLEIIAHGENAQAELIQREQRD